MDRDYEVMKLQKQQLGKCSVAYFVSYVSTAIIQNYTALVSLQFFVVNGDYKMVGMSLSTFLRLYL